MDVSVVTHSSYTPRSFWNRKQENKYRWGVPDVGEKKILNNNKNRGAFDIVAQTATATIFFEWNCFYHFMIIYIP